MSIETGTSQAHVEHFEKTCPAYIPCLSAARALRVKSRYLPAVRSSAFAFVTVGQLPGEPRAFQAVETLHGFRYNRNSIELANASIMLCRVEGKCGVERQKY